MHDPDNHPETLISVPSDLEAAMIVSALAAQGVDATTSGDFTAGFRAEAPGEVKVLVRRTDLARAQEALDEMALQQPAEQASAVAAATECAFGAEKLLTLGILILVAIAVLQSCF